MKGFQNHLAQFFEAFRSISFLIPVGLRLDQNIPIRGETAGKTGFHAI